MVKSSINPLMFLKDFYQHRKNEVQNSWHLYGFVCQLCSTRLKRNSVEYLGIYLAECKGAISCQINFFKFYVML